LDPARQNLSSGDHDACACAHRYDITQLLC
jgi:hypothetical protein